MSRQILISHFFLSEPAVNPPANLDGAGVERVGFRDCVSPEFPDNGREYPGLDVAMAMPAGIAAAMIIRHGIAAHTNSATTFWRAEV